MDVPGRFRFMAGRGVDPWTLLALGLALLVALPVIAVFGLAAIPTGPIWRHLAETVLLSYVGNTIGLLLGVGTGVLAIGVGTAWLVTMCRFPGRRLFQIVLLLPMAIPAYVIAHTYTGLLDFSGPVQTALRLAFGWSRRDYWFPELRSLGGAITMLTLVLYPYVYMLARAAFLEQSVCVIEISRTLGRSPWRSFFEVALPLARPALAAGVTLALMETLNDYGTVQYFAVDTFATGIFRAWFGMGQPGVAAQLAAMLMLFVLALVLAERLSRGRARFHQTSTRYQELPGYRLRGGRAAFAVLACAVPVLLGFVVPATALAVWAVETAPRMVDLQFLALARNSFLLAAIAALAAVGCAVLLAYSQRLSRSRAVAAANRVAAMGYAAPGLVVAVGIMLPFAEFDNRIDAFMRAQFGLSTGLLLSGTLIAVTYAYLVRFLAVALGTVEASLAKVTPNMDQAARTLGHGPIATLRRVHAPIMRPSLITAGTLVFVDVMKELPATLVMRPFNFDTLAIRVFELAGDERLADSASAALAIVLVGIVPVALLARAIQRGRPGHSVP
ncbi:MAG: iron ABC transporter permease [Alphaproteobacteria bacterium]|nr:iron ABC transporter permease [Alphaproteobacteria bacterium]